LLLAAAAGNAAAQWLPARPPEPQGNRSTFLGNDVVEALGNDVVEASPIELS
jgi:hypothetical protein